MEVWRIVPEFPRYEASNFGRVRVKPDAIDAIGRKRYSGHLLKQHIRNMYLSVTPRGESGKLYNRHVHRLVASAFLGPCEKGRQVNHKDGNKLNNRLTNLEYVTASENYKHALNVLKFQPPKGEAHWNAMRTDDQVAEVRRRALSGESHKKLAAEFGVSIATISRWRNGRRSASGHTKPTTGQLRKLKAHAANIRWNNV